MMVDWATYARRSARGTLMDAPNSIANDYDSTRGIYDGYQHKGEETDSNVTFKPSTI